MIFNFGGIDVKPDMRWFELLIEGISKSKGIAHSLKDIDLENWDIEQEEAYEVLQRFEMNRVKVNAKTSVREDLSINTDSEDLSINADSEDLSINKDSEEEY